MTDGQGVGEGAQLPPDTPREIRDFVSGDVSIVEIDTSSMHWLPRPLDVPPGTQPSVQIQPGATSTSATVHVSWGRFGFGRSAFTIGLVGGTLRIASSDLPPATSRALSEWVASFNRALREHELELDSLVVRGPIVRVTTRSAFPVARASAVVAGPVALAAMAALRRPGAPEVPPWRYRSQATKMLFLSALILMLCGGAVVIGTTLIPESDDESPVAIDETTSTTDVDTATTVAPSTTTTCVSDPTAPVAACPPAPPPPRPDRTSTSTTSTSSSSSTSSSTSSSSTSSSSSTTTAPPSAEPDVYLSLIPPDKRVECGESDIRVDSNGNGWADGCEVSGASSPPYTLPGSTIPATGSGTDVPLHIGVALILVGVVAMVAAHRRAADEHS